METDNYISISYLSQYYYCPRRAGLLMLEQAWEENEYTTAGSIGHENVHRPELDRRKDTIRIHDYYISSKRLELAGRCDLIEATADKGGALAFGARYALRPVEFKHGVIRDEFEYKAQLCAQAICLEERFATEIPEGDIYFIGAKRRVAVSFDAKLRGAVESGAAALREIMQSQKLPRAEFGPKCRKCSMEDYCGPRVKAAAKAYCQRVMVEAGESG